MAPGGREPVEAHFSSGNKHFQCFSLSSFASLFLVFFMFVSCCFHVFSHGRRLVSVKDPRENVFFSEKQHLVSYIVFSLNCSCLFEVFWKVFGRSVFSFLMFFSCMGV